MRAIKFLILFFIIGCSVSDLEFQGSTTVENGLLYVERFYSHKGGIGGYKLVYFITDSINFNKKIGVCDEKERIGVILVGDTIKITKFSSRNRQRLVSVDEHNYLYSVVVRNREYDK